MPAVERALVVGGGIGGLTAGIALRQQGIAVDLVEIKREWTVYGVGIIQPNNALRALDKIGLAAQCVERGGPFPGWKIFDALGNFLMDAPSSNAAAPAYPPINGITRPLLHQVLSESAVRHGVDIRLGVTVEAIDETDGHVDVTLTDGRRERYGIVIGADGAHSQMRSRLFGAELRPAFTGQIVWRYNLPRPAEVVWGHVYYGKRSKVGLTPLSPTLMYMFLVTEEPGNPRFPHEQLADLMRSRLAEHTGLVAELAKLIVDPDGVVYKPMEALRVPPPWHRGRTILIGDAAHTTTPQLAQGAAMAVEDAVLLAELLGRGTDLAAIFDEFMRRRFDRAAYVVDTSSTLAHWELLEWRGAPAPEADPGPLLYRASMKLLEDY
jgi:2-polyprenyl-6-methoxyphenol hydroxylase-like FAD-dependent oxidoreductase